MIFGSLTKLFKPSGEVLNAHQLYCHAVSQARQPFLYTHYHVADTLDGRFDMIALHVFLLSRALVAANTAQATLLNQTMIDRMFIDMDRSLREMGVGDVSIGKKVQKMAYALNGRMQSYDTALEEGAQALAASFLRNVYRNQAEARAHAEALANYALQAETALRKATLEEVIAGTIVWPEAPQPSAA